ncbi:hypothetical protein Vretimale_13190 [Volvox reticuliferus]|uniref:Sel1 repeat family protein n=2 Tax=Volvox reticuliferus TaxID=1737510 RepID=A0A8J4FSY7_9CHLO|nr:hypothetical protein Vretifemale_14205 [Volvox reticuliferus]GIM09365.1 hypothetical protein Vretimale_13190 [Volvox reticuliferus]
MLLMFAGAAIGVCGAVSWLNDRRRQRLLHVRDDAVESSELSPSPGDEFGNDEGPCSNDINARRRLPASNLAAIAIALGSLMAVSGGTLLATRQMRSGGKRHRLARGGPPRIPLKELVRFREQQWFLEELENSRDGDPNAMLRLAKMYLYGQGCDRSVNIAQEWLRRARAGGVYCTLDELLTAEDLESIRRQSRASNGERQQQLDRRQYHGHHSSHYMSSTALGRH